MPDDDVERLRAALLGGVAEAPIHRQKAAFVLRSRVLERVGRGLAERGLDALLVKGAAIALTHYRPAWSRAMEDLDLVARRGQRERVAAALEEAGCTRLPLPEGRVRSKEAFGETALFAREGSADTLVPHRVDYAAIFARSSPAPDLPGLLVPSPEDHALLVVLHAAGHEMRHAIALLDLHLLLRGGVAQGALEARARGFGVAIPLWVALSTLRGLGSSAVSADLVARLDPGPVRRALLAGFYDVGRWPVAKRPLALGLPWVVAQWPLRDDPLRYLGGALRYAALRGIEALGAR